MASFPKKSTTGEMFMPQIGNHKWFSGIKYLLDNPNVLTVCVCQQFAYSWHIRRVPIKNNTIPIKYNVARDKEDIFIEEYYSNNILVKQQHVPAIDLFDLGQLTTNGEYTVFIESNSLDNKENNSSISNINV